MSTDESQPSDGSKEPVVHFKPEMYNDEIERWLALSAKQLIEGLANLLDAPVRSGNLLPRSIGSPQVPVPSFVLLRLAMFLKKFAPFFDIPIHLSNRIALFLGLPEIATLDEVVSSVIRRLSSVT